MRHMFKFMAFLTLVVFMWVFPEVSLDTIEENQFKAFEITVEGAVQFPKTLRFYKEVTWNDILTYVGGYLDVDPSYQPNTFNFNETTVIQVPFAKAVVEDNQIIKININKASFQQLLTIPYMTETRAAELIIFRQLNGAFSSIEELIHVKFIGSVTLENMRPYITIL